MNHATHPDTHYAFNRKAPWNLTEATEVARESFAAIVRPQTPLGTGEDVMVLELANNQYMVSIEEGDRVKRYGVMDADAFDLLIEAVEPIYVDDPTYAQMLADSIEALCFFSV